MSLIVPRLVTSAANALLGHVTPCLRACMIDFDEREKTIHSYFIYDQQIDDFLFDLASCVSTEIIADLECAEIQLCEDHFIHLSHFEKIPFRGHLVYLRYEPNLEGHYPNVRYTQFLEETSYFYAFLFLDMQNALLTKVTPALREALVTIQLQEKIIDLHFLYDGPISELDYHLATLAAQGGNASFPDFSVRTFIERCDFPQKISSIVKAERVVYARYEDMSLLTDNSVVPSRLYPK
jgi:hypothetical protein